MAYSLPHDVYLLLESAFNQDREKAEEKISDKKQALKAELYNDLRSELATKEFVRAELAVLREEVTEFRAEVRGEIKHINFQLKLLIGFAIFGLTLFNPSFVKLVEMVLK